MVMIKRWLKSWRFLCILFFYSSLLFSRLPDHGILHRIV
ncbi:hypothetical protein M214_3144 [Acinetobacter baumannii CI86]|nr:hypothetical protein M214_3144 [Acinetobacter baumannii CI86]